MNESEMIKRSKEFLDSIGATYLDNPEIDIISEDVVEITFLKPETLDPNVVIDPPDEIVSLNIKTGKMHLVPQM